MLDQVASILKTDSLSERNSCQSHTSTCKKSAIKVCWCISNRANTGLYRYLWKGMPALYS